MYEGIKQTLGQPKKKTAPLKSTKASPLRRISSRRAPHWQALITVWRCLQERPEGLGHFHQRIGNPGLRPLSLEAGRVLKRHLPPNRRRQRDKRGRPEIREIDQQQTTNAYCSERTVIPELVFPATQGSVWEPPIRERHYRDWRMVMNDCCAKLAMEMTEIEWMEPMKTNLH